MRKHYSHNEDYFEVIDTEPKAYWLGFMAADGCVRNCSHSKWIFSINQAVKDVHHIQKFKEAIEATNPIYYQNKTNSAVRLRINSKKTCLDLIDKGIVPNKSLILEPPKNVLQNLIRHWIRGYFDGDGCISIRPKRKGRKRVTILGTNEVCEFISSQIPFNTPISKFQNIYRVRINREKAIQWVYQYFYLDSTVFLERKHIKFCDEEGK